jgi:hypothetical protein
MAVQYKLLTDKLTDKLTKGPLSKHECEGVEYIEKLIDAYLTDSFDGSSIYLAPTQFDYKFTKFANNNIRRAFMTIELIKRYNEAGWCVEEYTHNGGYLVFKI